MQFLKRTLPERIIRKIGRHPVAVVSSLSLTFRMGKDGLKYREGEIDAPELRKRAGFHVGSLSGGLAGAAMMGVMVPGLGILGAFAGGIAGETMGGKIGRFAIEQVERIVIGAAQSEAPASEEDEKASGSRPQERARRHL